MESIRARVYGKVQGVSYRWFTRVAALSLGITGAVTNMPDGSVKVTATGDTDKIDRFIDLLTQGPPRAQVDVIEITPIPTRRFHRFVILV